MGKPAFFHYPKSSAQCDGVIAEQKCFDVGLHEMKLLVHEQHRIAVVLEQRIQYHNLQTLVAQMTFKNLEYGLVDLYRYRIAGLTLLGGGRRGEWAASS